MLLSPLLLIPLGGALLVAVMPRRRLPAVRVLAALAAALVLLQALALLTVFDPAEAGIQLFETHRWNPRFGMAFALGIDGVALPMVLLASLLCLVAVLASWSQPTLGKGYFLLLLLLETALLGVFIARDWSLFYVFWELTLIPLFFLIDRYGGAERQRAALNFVLYTMGGSVFLLVALLVLFDVAPGHSFAMADMATGALTLAPAVQTAIFVGMLVGFGVKMPIFPLHGWLPLAHVEAPAPVSILLSGILLKMGSYGLIRAVDTLPAAALALQPVLVALAIFSLFYGGVLAWRERDLKAMVAYASVSHMGVVLLGIATLNPAGLAGALMQMVAHGLLAAALFLFVGLLYGRTHTRDIADYGALWPAAPRFSVFAAIVLMAAIGLPGTASFVAELYVLIGGLERFGAGTIVIMLAALVSAAYALRTLGRLLSGPAQPAVIGLVDLDRRETLLAGVLCAAIVVLGFVPGPLLKVSAASLHAVARSFLP